MLVNGQYLFPLRTLSSQIGDSYFLSADERVFSNRSGTLVELKGSKTSSGTYYKFGQQYGSGWRHDSIVKLARAHKTWAAEILGAKITQKPQEVAAWPTPADREHATSAEDGVKAKGQIIGRLHNGRLVFGHDPKVHLSDVSVSAEMTRLASVHPGVKFVALKITKSVISGGVVWE